MPKNKISISLFFLVNAFICVVFGVTQNKSQEFTGVYWGAFDPLTEAHTAIILNSFNQIPLKELIIVVNNHAYKNYTYSLETRLQMIRTIIQHYGLEKIDLRSQDESHQIDFKALKQITQSPLCAIAGYDSYKKWVEYSTSYDRACYDAIAVTPRGDDDPILFDIKAFLLPIDLKYKDVSSTKVKASLLQGNG